MFTDKDFNIENNHKNKKEIQLNKEEKLKRIDRDLVKKNKRNPCNSRGKAFGSKTMF